MAIDVLSANLYELTGDGLQVTYSTTSLRGLPQLNYSDGQQQLSFSGDDLELTQTSIGTLATVTIRRSVDANYTTFSLLVPEVHLDDRYNAISTVGIETVHHFLAAAPNLIKGPLTTYVTHALTGNASFVEF